MKCEKCKKCGRGYNVLVNGVCHHCNPEAWNLHFKKIYGIKGGK